MRTGSGILLGGNSPFKNIPLLGMILRTKNYSHIEMQRYGMPIDKFITETERRPPTPIRWQPHENLAYPAEPLSGSEKFSHNKR